MKYVLIFTLTVCCLIVGFEAALHYHSIDDPSPYYIHYFGFLSIIITILIGVYLNE